VKIAYLAPEIPALSATFVYKEILMLQELGLDVVSFSVHRPSSKATERVLDGLKESVSYLYENKRLNIIRAHLSLLLTRPKRYFSAIACLIKDVMSVGLLSRNALGLVFRFFYAGYLADQLLKNKCQHLHVHFAHVPTDIAMYASAFSGVSFSITAHANDIFERGWLLKEKAKRSAFFATISEFNRRYLLESGVDAAKLKIVRCGVDAEQFSRRLGFVANEVVKIGLVGRLVEKKGIDTLIKAVALVKQKGLSFELLIAGSGPLDNELAQLVKTLGLDSTEVQFLGAMPHAEVAAFITRLDMFVLPCKQDSYGDMDGVPVVLMEAMLSGVPVISTELSGIPELVINETTGLLVKPNDETALAEAIIRLVNDETLREEMIVNAINKVQNDFSLAGNAQKLKDMFSLL